MIDQLATEVTAAVETGPMDPNEENLGSVEAAAIPRFKAATQNNIDLLRGRLQGQGR